MENYEEGQRGESIFMQISNTGRGILDQISECVELNRPKRMAELCDLFGQFLCDASKEYQVMAKKHEEFVDAYLQENPEEREAEIRSLTKQYTDMLSEASLDYMNRYREWEKLQEAIPLTTGHDLAFLKGLGISS